MVLRFTCGVLLAAALAVAQNDPKFPTTAATAQELPFANRAVSTTLELAIDATELTILVADSSSIAHFPTVITIDDEEILLCSKLANTLTVCAGGRGFGDTGGSAHSPTVGGVKTPVVGRLSSKWMNQFVDEVRALEACLKTGGCDIAVGIDCSSPTELTIAAGVVTVPSPGCFTIDTEADSATDDLATIMCSAGTQFIFSPENDARTVVVKTGTSIPIAADFELNNINDVLMGHCRIANVVVAQYQSNGP